MASDRRVAQLTKHLTVSTSPAKADEVANYRIRQVAWVVKDLDKSIRELCSALKLSPTFRDPEIHLLGLTNCVCVLGDQFLEMVCPQDPSNTASKQLERRKGDGGYMVMLQTPDYNADKIRLVDSGEFQSVLDVHRDEVSEMHLHPRDTAKCIVSFSQTFPNVKEWLWGGPDWKVRSKSSATLCKCIKGVIIQAEKPEAAVIQYRKLLGVQPQKVSDDDYRFKLSDLSDLVSDSAYQEIRIITAKDGRGDGLFGMLLEVSDRSQAGKSFVVSGLNIFLE